jgi:uncharacterized membrane protein (DUF2068 family)
MTRRPDGGPPAPAVRWVAGVEALKGILVLLTGVALLRLAHPSAQAIAEEVVRHLHLNPAHRLPRVLLEAAGQLTDPRLRWLALGAAGYAFAHLVEAYGLWWGYRWAKLMGVLMSGVAVPLELLELRHRVTVVGLAVLTVNLGVVTVLWRAYQRRGQGRSAGPR